MSARRKSFDDDPEHKDLVPCRRCSGHDHANITYIIVWIRDGRQRASHVFLRSYTERSEGYKDMR